jgi:hypothetical protein
MKLLKTISTVQFRSDDFDLKRHEKCVKSYNMESVSPQYILLEKDFSSNTSNQKNKTKSYIEYTLQTYIIICILLSHVMYTTFIQNQIEMNSTPFHCKERK